MAGASGGIRVEGLNQLIRALNLTAHEVDDLKDAFQELSQEGARAAAAFAPKRSGALAGSIRGNRAKNKAVISAGRGGSVPYAGPINYGWAKRNIRANGFMQRADEQLKPKAVTVLKREIDKLIARRGLA